MELQLVNLLAFVISIVAASAVGAERGSSLWLRRQRRGPSEKELQKDCHTKCEGISKPDLKAACACACNCACEGTCKKGVGGWLGPSKSAAKCADSCPGSGFESITCTTNCFFGCTNECDGTYGLVGVLAELCQYGCKLYQPTKKSFKRPIKGWPFKRKFGLS